MRGGLCEIGHQSRIFKIEKLHAGGGMVKVGGSRGHFGGMFGIVLPDMADDGRRGTERIDSQFSHLPRRSRNPVDVARMIVNELPENLAGGLFAEFIGIAGGG